jgi:hypothetical protein
MVLVLASTERSRRCAYPLPWNTTSTLGAATNREYFYDYAGQDPINGYDLSGKNFCDSEHNCRQVLNYWLTAAQIIAEGLHSGGDPWGSLWHWVVRHKSRILGCLSDAAILIPVGGEAVEAWRAYRASEDVAGALGKYAAGYLKRVSKNQLRGLAPAPGVIARSLTGGCVG